MTIQPLKPIGSLNTLLMVGDYKIFPFFLKQGLAQDLFQSL